MLRFIDVLPLWLFATTGSGGHQLDLRIAVHEVKLDGFAERFVPRDSQLFRQLVDGGQVTIRNRDSCIHAPGTAILVPGRMDDREVDSDGYSASTSRSPASTRSISSSGREETCSESIRRSTVASCETLTTESLGSRLSLASMRTLPIARARSRLDVTVATSTVSIWLWLKVSLCTTRKGLRNPGPDPRGGGRVAHQSSPLRTLSLIHISEPTR